MHYHRENAERYFFVCREMAANENPQSRFQREQRLSLPPQGQVVFIHRHLPMDKKEETSVLCAPVVSKCLSKHAPLRTAECLLQ
jgi:hypothetical protein